jgi:alkylation response protein AidB-like acyl-CoA dehydrogenase
MSDDVLLGELRRALATGPGDVDRRLRQLDLLYAGVPEPVGAGGDPTLPLAVVEECARHLSSPPWPLTGVLAARTLLAAGADLDDVLAGVRRPAVCWPGVFGSETAVLDGAAADGLVRVRSRDGGEAEVSVLDLDRRTPLDPLDPTRPLAAVVPGGGAATIVPARPLRAFWLLALAADCLGTMRACLDLALSYARDREAFGRPIGAFQAVRHRCADLYADVETSRAAVTGGGAAWAAGSNLALVTALAAAAHALDAVVRVAEAVVLLHGAMGFTREAAPQAYLRRAYAAQALGPRVRDLRIELATA